MALSGRAFDRYQAVLPIGAKALLYNHKFPGKLIDALAAFGGHDEGVAEKYAEIPVGGDRVRFGHEHHAGLEYALERFRADMVGEHVRPVGDEIDPVRMNWT